MPTPQSRTNSIEIFIDADGAVTFSDLPAELADVMQTLAAADLPDASWCSLLPAEADTEDS
ncbi:MAG: hypothetical protein IGS03_08130 [Candidatus Sericytochromatia bacterium]|nr:hypothetical protein [Candidatus Sericytochromatia bacterium]